MTRIYVDHARIQTAAAQLHTHKRRFDEILAQLESDLAPMISTWSGEARELYLTKQHAWHAAARDLTVLLGNIAQLTENAHAGYVQTVADVKEMWT